MVVVYSTHYVSISNLELHFFKLEFMVITSRTWGQKRGRDLNYDARKDVRCYGQHKMMRS